MEQIEANHSQFNLELYLKARDVTIQVIDLVREQLEEGMSEDDAKKLTQDAMGEFGIKKKWHPTTIRFGKNTLLTFREKSDESVRLSKGDIYFFDLGPVWQEHEGDIGRSYVFGENPEAEKMVEDTNEIFQLCVNEWKERNLTGKQLYDFAETITKEKGYILNLKMDGHRLGSFPHQVFYRGGLAEIETVPIKDLWILELLIRHPEKPIGTFYEDIITH